MTPWPFVIAAYGVAVALTVERKLAALAAMASAGLDVHVSVDLTQLGHLQSPQLGLDNVLRIAQAVPPVSEDDWPPRPPG